MAGDWIKIRHALPRSGVVVRIMSACKADRLRTLGGLVSALLLFDEQTEDGILPGYTVEIFDEVIGFPGLGAALCDEKVGWMIKTDEGLILTDWEKHNGTSAKRRVLDTERKRNKRKEPVRKMSASEADKNRTREEKRREEYIESSLRSDSCPVSQPDPTPGAELAQVKESEESENLSRFKAEITEIIEHLNAVSGRSYRIKCKSNREPIAARLAETDGDLAGIKVMISRQATRWRGDSKMDDFLRPSTLFAPSNFENYYANRELPVEPPKPRNGINYDGAKGTLNEGWQCPDLADIGFGR